MPHVVLHTSSPLHELLDDIEPFVVREENTVWRLRDVYINRTGGHALAECLVVTDGRQRRFFVHLGQRDADASVVVRPYGAPVVEAAPSIKRMIALVAEAVYDAHDDVEIGHSTIGGFFSDRYTFEPDPQPGEWDPLVDEEHLPRPVDWSLIYGNDHPVEIEIGSGKGSFLVEAARAEPDTNFLSVEYARPYAEHIRERLRRRDLRNVRVVHADAARFFTERVPRSSVRTVHVYFPDPWPKKRHRKRRLMQAPFVSAATEALAPEGEIRFVTDHGKYFAQSIEALDAEPRLRALPVDEEQMTDLTNYERKYRAEGREIHRARYQRTP